MSDIGIIGDTHLPYTHPKYLGHCCRIRDKYPDATWYHAGDMYDFHSSSFHSSDPDLYSAGKELELAAKHAAKWYKEFPNLKLIIGNHDAIPARKAFEAGLSNRIVRDMNEVFDTPNWMWSEEYIIKGGRHHYWLKHSWPAKTIQDGGNGGYSVIAGHIHSKAQVIWSQFPRHSTFSLQVGCGVNSKLAAFRYAKQDRRMSIMACATIIDGQPQIHRMFI
jgi:hypothetical protein